MKKLDRKTRTILFLSFGLFLGLGAAFLYSTPRIESFHPGNAEHAGTLATIAIHFNTDMDPACASQHITISPAIAGAADWQGSTYRFVPVQTWPAGTPVVVRITSGACSARGLPLWQDASYSFLPLPPRVAYLQTAGNGTLLRATNPEDGTTTDLHASAHAIFGFDVSARGDWIAFSEQTATGADLWRIDTVGGARQRLLDCGREKCVSPTLSPDGTRLAFQRGELPIARISVLELASGKETQISPAGHASAAPSWNPRGWLSYYDSEQQAVALDDLHGGTTYLPTLGGANWSWAPDGLSLVIPEIVMTPDADSDFDESESEAPVRLYNQLVRIRASDNQAINLSGGQPWDDASPSFSPDGTRLAFARQQLGENFTMGRQLWWMALASGESHALTHDEEYNFSAIRWSADGKSLAYMRFHVTAPLDPPEVWVSAADGSHPHRISVGGYLPHWLP